VALASKWNGGFGHGLQELLRTATASRHTGVMASACARQMTSVLPDPRRQDGRDRGGRTAPSPVTTSQLSRPGEPRPTRSQPSIFAWARGSLSRQGLRLIPPMVRSALPRIWSVCASTPSRRRHDPRSCAILIVADHPADDHQFRLDKLDTKLRGWRRKAPQRRDRHAAQHSR